MVFSVRGDDVRDMALQLKKLTGAPTMADAIRIALRNEIEGRKASVPLRDKIRAQQADFAADLGPEKVDFDMKDFWAKDEDA